MLPSLLPSSVSDSKNSLLDYIWSSSWLLAMLSLIIMCALILVRIITEYYQHRRELRKKELIGLFFLYLSAPITLDHKTLNVKPADTPIIREIVTELLRVIQGDDIAKLLHLLQILGIMEAQEIQLKKGTVRERVRAVFMLALFDSAHVRQLLAGAMDDPNIQVQLAAIRGVADLQATELFPAVLAKLRAMPRLSSLVLVELLQRFGNEAIPELTRVAREDESLPLRLAAVQVIGSADRLETVAVLIELCTDSSASIRAASFAALAKIGDPRAESVLLQGLNDPAWQVRMQAVYCAGCIGAVTAIPLLHTLLEDTEWGVGFYAAEALYKLGNPGIMILQLASRSLTSGGRIAHLTLAERRYE